MTTTRSDERRQEAREQLESAVRELMTSEGWVRWMNTRSKFHRYSFNNTLMIASQRPDATQVAGYKTWQKLGRQVRKGEHGIKIFAPSPVIVRDDEGEARTNDAGEPMRRMFFRVVSVFDVTQTDGDELPEAPMAPIAGDSHAHLLPVLETMAGELGFSVIYPDGLAADVGGYCNAQRKEIAVRPSMPANKRVRTLIHEIAHAHGVSYTDYGRHDAEVIVESVAYIVSQGIGLDTSGESLAYIASWGGASDLEALKQFASVVDEIATKMEAGLASAGSTVAERAA